MKYVKVFRTVIEWATVLLVALGATLLLTSAGTYAGASYTHFSAPRLFAPDLPLAEGMPTIFAVEEAR